MQPNPDDPGPGEGRFQTTRWQDIVAARDPAGPGAREALEGLCRAYWYPLYAYVRHKGYPREQAEDLTQGFFSDGLARDFLRAVDPGRGRFRSFLLACFESYLKNEYERRMRVKRGGRVATVSIDAGEAEDRYRREPAHVATAERLYDRRWALTLLDRALGRLEREMADRGKGPLFDRLRPSLSADGDAAAYARVAAELGMSEGAVKVAAHRLRGRLRDLIREEVAATVADPTQVDDEIRDLFSALGILTPGTVPGEDHVSDAPDRGIPAMTETRTCPRCGRELPEDARGLCPACLLTAALAGPGDAPDEIPEPGGETPGAAAAPGPTIGPPGMLATTVASDAQDPDVPPAPGSAVRYFGDYEVQAELGRGGMGVVYRARQVSLNRPVALKLLRAGVLAGEDELRRFQNEAEAVALLDHPGIVPVYEVGDHAGRRYFSMKLIQGGNLADRLAAYRGGLRAAAALVAEAAEAVHHAHVRGILHRDLKPANILVDDACHPHVTDFGLAKRLEGDAELTATGAVLGTPAYMAPEQALGRRGAITTATDVHVLGTVLYAMLTGHAPFEGDSVVDTLTKVKEQAPAPPRKLNAKVPRDLEVICLKCLEKDPRRRYASAQAVADDLRTWLGGRPIAARPVAAPERAAKFVRRRPALAAAYALTAAVLVLAGLGGSVAWLWREAVRARVEAVVARDDAIKARAVAERASNSEKNARALAEKARDGEARARAEAERQREKLERFDYGRTLQVAHQEWRENNVGPAVDLLNSTRRDLRGWEWRYLCRLFHSELLTLTGHSARARSASFDPDGSRIITASEDNTAKVWDARTGAELLSFKGHTDYVRSASFSPDGSRIITASQDKTARVWDATTGACLLTLKGHANAVASASFSPDGSRVVTGSFDRTAKVWDVRTGAELLTLKGHASDVVSASFSRDGARIVTASSDNTAKVWQAETGAELLTLRPQSGQLWWASFSPDGSWIVTAGMAKEAKVWQAETGAELLTLKGHANAVASASFSPDGSRVVTGSFDRTAKVWDVRTGAELLTLKGHTGSVFSASFSPDGSRIVTASWDMTTKVWDARPFSPR